MKRLKLCLIALIICFGLYGCKGIDFTSTRRYADCMNLNWHLSLPETDVVIYGKKILVPALPVMAPDTTFSNTMKKMQLSF